MKKHLMTNPMFYFNADGGAGGGASGGGSGGAAGAGAGAGGASGDGGGAAGGAGGAAGGGQGGDAGSALGGKGASLGSFLDSISDDNLRRDPALEPLRGKDATEAAKMLANAQKMIGKKRLEAPNEKWTDLEWNEFYKTVGRPETPDGYGLKPPELPEGLPYDEKMDKHFASLAHKAGLSPKQLEIMRGGYTQYVTEAFTGHTQSREQQAAEWQKQVEQEFGKELPVKLAQASQAVQVMGGDELLTVLNQAGLGDHPVVVRAFAKMGAELAEDQAAFGQSRTGLASSPERAANEIAELRADPEFMKAYNDASHVGHKRAVEKLTQLYSVKNGNK